MEEGHLSREKRSATSGAFRVWFNRLLLCIGLFPVIAIAQGVSGTVTDEAGVPLPYATIFIQNTTTGVLSNETGAFQLTLPEGSYTLVVKYLGYQTRTFQVNISKAGYFQLPVVLKEEEISTEEVVITDDGRDPAFAIMEKVLENKKRNEHPFKTYQYNAYSKTTIRMRITMPDSGKLGLGFGLMNEDTKKEVNSVMGDKGNSILYLSETISTVYKEEPGQIKEDIRYSKVSGDQSEYSLLGNLWLQFNPYDNLIQLEGITNRALVSPISDNCFLSYDYKLLGSSKEGPHTIYRIQVIPKRDFDPVVSGIVYVVDGAYALKGLDILAGKHNQLNLIDTLVVKQQYLSVNDTSWMPFSTEFSFGLRLGFGPISGGFTGTSASVLSDYQTGMTWPPRFFSKEQLTIADSALQDTSFWNRNRPVPLEKDEARDYEMKDSLFLVQHTPEYLDSLTRTQHLRPLGLIFTGYTRKNYRTHSEFRIEPLVSSAGFNTMEGWFAGIELSKTWRKEEDFGPWFRIAPAFRYGFDNQQFSWKLGADKYFSSFTKMRLTTEVGNYVRVFGTREQITPFLNTVYTLLREQNYQRLYQATYGYLSLQRRVANGLLTRVWSRYEVRHDLPNASYDTWRDVPEREYTENILFPEHTSWTAGLEFRYRPFNKYMCSPKGLLDLGSRWPTLVFGGSAGIPAGGSAVLFLRLRGGVQETYTIGLLGDLSFELYAGTFLSRDSVPFADYQHFKGNQTRIRHDEINQFYLMPYYTTSTTLPYVEGHAEHNFGGFFTNKLPVLRRLNLNEIAGVHVLYTDLPFTSQDLYLEMNIGAQFRIRRLVPVRADWVYRFAGPFGALHGFNVTVGL